MSSGTVLGTIEAHFGRFSAFPQVSFLHDLTCPRVCEDKGIEGRFGRKTGFVPSHSLGSDFMFTMVTCRHGGLRVT